MFPKVNVPGEGYIGSESSPTGVTDIKHAANEPLTKVVVKQM